MPKPAFPSLSRSLRSFTLIELLAVIAIIAILAALTLVAGEAVTGQAARSRARSEIQGMSTALENYKSDNAVYPLADTFANTNAYTGVDGSVSGGVYQESSQILYQALSGKTNFEDVPVAGNKAYMSFKANQLGNATAAAGNGAATSTYIQDPYGYSYGYFTGTPPNPGANPPVSAAPPNNGTGFFDLWSTGGVLSGNLQSTPALQNKWISNWSQP